jgi:Zn-finger nucleic acid-binding protein
MKCPQCPESVLVMSDRQGVEIDYCPQCRGVWLDRGEIDKIVERSMTAIPTQQQVAPAPQPPPHPQPQQSQDFGHSDYNKSHSGHGNYKRKSWLNELFD